MSSSKFNKFVVIDCETTGLNYEQTDMDVTKNHQSVSWGFILSDIRTLKSIQELYVEIQHNGESVWTNKAEKVHGLSREHLLKHGETEEVAAELIAQFLGSHFDIDTPIICMGQNVASFDIPFLKKLLYKFDWDFKFSQRTIDTFSLAAITLGVSDAQEMFDILDIKRGSVHNALEDTRCTLEAARKIQQLFLRN